MAENSADSLPGATGIDRAHTDRGRLGAQVGLFDQVGRDPAAIELVSELAELGLGIDRENDDVDDFVRVTLAALEVQVLLRERPARARALSRGMGKLGGNDSERQVATDDQVVRVARASILSGEILSGEAALRLASVRLAPLGWGASLTVKLGSAWRER